MRVLRVLLAAATAACSPKPPPKAPLVEAPASDAVALRYAAGSLVQDVELQLTDTGVGHYLEAEARLSAALELSLVGAVLRTQWSLQSVAPLELAGTVAPHEDHEARGFLLTRGKGVAVGDVHGAVDTTVGDADPVNVARRDAMSAAPPAGALLMGELSELLRLPRLPAEPLRVGGRAELEEESETVAAYAGTELVLPTTTVHRFTLRGVDEQGGARVAEVELEAASVAETPDDAAEPAARLASHIEATLLLDLDAGVPVSLDLSRTETFEVDGTTRERSVTLRSRFRSP